MYARLVKGRFTGVLWLALLSAYCQSSVMAQEVEPPASDPGQEVSGGAAPWLRSFIPEALRVDEFAGLEYWQWLGIFALIFLAVVVDFASRLFLRPVVRACSRRYLGDPDEQNVRFVVRPIGLSLGAIVFLATLNLLGITGTARTVLTVAGQVVVTFGLAWAAWAVTDLVSGVLLKRAHETATILDDMLIPLGRKATKLFIVAIGLLYVADSFNIALAPLLGGLGLAGLAVSFAAQDIVKNVFGGVMIFMDRPFYIGERIKYGEFDGVITEIGFRTTKLRSLTGHLVTIPNGAITNNPVENIGRRPSIRRILNVTITYDTPHEKIVQAVEIIRGILEEEGIREPIHPLINGEPHPPRVFFNEYNDVSLNIFVIYWYVPVAYWDYMEHAQKFNLRLFEEFGKADIEFAFPTQTLFMAGDAKRELSLKLLKADL